MPPPPAKSPGGGGGGGGLFGKRSKSKKAKHAKLVDGDGDGTGAAMGAAGPEPALEWARARLGEDPKALLHELLVRCSQTRGPRCPEQRPGPGPAAPFAEPPFCDTTRVLAGRVTSSRNPFLGETAVACGGGGESARERNPAPVPSAL